MKMAFQEFSDKSHHFRILSPPVKQQDASSGIPIFFLVEIDLIDLYKTHDSIILFLLVFFFGAFFILRLV